MSIIIKTLKNNKKISKDLYKTLKSWLNVKPNLRLGIQWSEGFVNVTNNFKKLKKLDWSESKVFPLSLYKEGQLVSLDKDLKEIFLANINYPKMHYDDLSKRYEELLTERTIKNLFLFNNKGGVDLMMFFIDSRGNFVFNDFESKANYINLANNGNEIVSAGIKSILKAKKIICFCIDESAKDVVFKLNKKMIDEDDVLTYLHMHNDVTLYTLRSIINKNEINEESMSQNIQELKNKLLHEVDENKFFDAMKAEEEKEETNDAKKYNYEESSSEFEYDKKSKEEDENNLFESCDIKLKEDEICDNLDLKDSIDLPELDIDYYSEPTIEEEQTKELNLLDTINELNKEIKPETNNASIENEGIEVSDDNLPNNKKDLIKYIEIKEATLKQIEAFLYKNNLDRLKDKKNEEYFLVNKKIPDLEKIKSEQKPNFASNKDLKEEVNNNNHETKYSIEYIIGIRPTPMLMVWHDKNEKFFSDLVETMKNDLDIKFNQEWDTEIEHVWNDGAYIIYDKNSYNVKSLAFSSDDRLFYLLRYINKPLKFNFDTEKEYNKLQELKEKWVDEVRVVDNYEQKQ